MKGESLDQWEREEKVNSSVGGEGREGGRERERERAPYHSCAKLMRAEASSLLW